MDGDINPYLAEVGWTDKHHLGEKKEETEDGCSSGVKYIFIIIISLMASYPIFKP